MSAAMREEFGKVGVLFGGRSAERDISLMSGTGMTAAIRRSILCPRSPP